MAQLFPTALPQNPWLAPKQIPSIQDYFKSGGIFAEKPLDTTPPTTQQAMTLAESTAKNGTAANPNSPVVQQAQAQQGPPPMNPVTGVAGAQQQQQAAAANPFYTPQTPDGQWIAGAQPGDHYDPGVKYTWGIAAGDREGGGATMLAAYNGNNDHARWSYAQNSNETSWDHWDRLRHDLMKKYGMGIQQASDEALRQMYAAYQAAGKDWSETGFSAVPGVKANGAGAGAGAGTGNGAGAGAGSGSGSGATVTTNPNMGPYSTTQADVLLTGENGQDPYAALREALRRSGVNLDAPGLMSSYIKRRFQNVAEALMGTAGLGNGGDKYGEVNNLIQLLGQGLTTPGVNLGTALQQRAGGILNSADFAKMMGSVDQNQAIDYLKTIEALNTFGAPDLMQAAAAANFSRLENRFRDTSFGLIGGDQYKSIPDFLTWLRQNAAPGTIPGF